MHKHYSLLYFIGSLSLLACVHPRSIVLSPTAPEGVRVYGVGEAAGTPDVARTQLGVEVRAATAEQAVAEGSQRMAAVVDALKQAGIPDADLRTSQYSLSFEQDSNQPPQPLAAAAAPAQAAAKPQPPAADTKPSPRGHYRVTNTVTVTIRDLSKVGHVLQAAADADANSAYGISFDLDDDEKLVLEARKLAIADARRSAEDLAKLTDVELGEVISITEEEPQGAQPNTYAMAASPVSVPIEQGEITIRYGVQLVYATHRK
ncbi:MAG TPA: SIMPL domain-containing protein [Polyangiales bacterium]|nr:SIMPL domain-containing protein [Polyangiales bacterium]